MTTKNISPLFTMEDKPNIWSTAKKSVNPARRTYKGTYRSRPGRHFAKSRLSSGNATTRWLAEARRRTENIAQKMERIRSLAAFLQEEVQDLTYLNSINSYAMEDLSTMWRTVSQDTPCDIVKTYWERSEKDDQKDSGNAMSSSCGVAQEQEKHDLYGITMTQKKYGYMGEINGSMDMTDKKSYSSTITQDPNSN